MAKIDFDTVLVWHDGVPIPLTPQAEGSSEPSPPTTLKEPVMQVLLNPLQEDATTPGRNYRLYQLADAVKRGGQVDLEAGDIALIKDRIEKMQGPWIVGQCFDALEGRTAPLRLNDPPSPEAAMPGKQFARPRRR